MLHSFLVRVKVMVAVGEDVEDVVALDCRRGRSRLYNLRGNESSNYLFS